SGNVGSAAQPAVFGDGLLWVEANHDPSGLVELKCTAMCGSGRATLGLVCKPELTSVASLGFFTTDDMRLNPDSKIDSYDSTKGSYASQVGSKLNNMAIVGSNGAVSIASGDTVFGDAISGTASSVSLANGAFVTGKTSSRSSPETLNAVEVPDI